MATSSSKALRKEPRAVAKGARGESTRPPASSKAGRVGSLKTPVPPKPETKAADKAQAKAEAGKSKSTPKSATSPTAVPSKATSPKTMPPTVGNGIAVDSSAKGAADKQALKLQLGKLAAASAQIAGLKRNLLKSFYDVGEILSRVRREKLYEVKGYGSFESFLERELDINKVTSLRMTRIAEVLRREDAVAAGLERASAAVAALDGEAEVSHAARPLGSPASALPFHKQ